MTDRGGIRAATRLAVVPSPESQATPQISFCSHCGARPVSDANTRVCESCGLGVVLQTNSDTAPDHGGAFLVIDERLSVCAVSSAAERLLATRETDAVNSHLTELLVPADAEAQGPINLAVAVTWAARGDTGARRVTVRPSNTFGVRISARIASCGPPRAALLMFD